MASQYDAYAVSTLATITERGATITFREDTRADAENSDYNPADDSFVGPSANVFTGKAVKVKADPVALQAEGLIIRNPIELLVAAKGIPTPAIGMTLTFGAFTANIKKVSDVNPDGATPILYRVVGEA